MADSIKVGDVCTVERRWGSRVDHRWTTPVAKVTPKRVYLDDRSWFALDDARREVKPRYLDYVTRVVEVAPTEGEGRR